MATITVAIGAQTKSWAVSSGDITRIVNGLKTHYGQVSEGATPPVMRDRTNTEVFDLVSSGFIQSLKDVVQRQEGDSVALTARNTIVPVSST